MTTIGAMRHLVTLKNPSPPVPDGVGGFYYMYIELDPAVVAAAIVIGSPRNLERDPANTVLATNTYLVTIRFHPDVTTQTRIAWQRDETTVREFNVTGIRDPDFRGEFLELTCEDVVL